MRRISLIFSLYFAACGATDPAPTVAKIDAQAKETVDPTLDMVDDAEAAACVVSSQCGNKTEQCLSGKCVAQQACKSDKNCNIGLVCAKDLGFCVECLETVDCPTAGNLCKAHHCIAPALPCAASKDCTKGQVCDKVAGLCLECITANDCAEGQACSETVCVPAGCLKDSAVCLSATTLNSCKADLSAMEAKACAAKTVCDDGACKAQVCTPNADYCDGSKHLKCDGSGLKPTTVADCAATPGQVCQNGACISMACAPGATSCADAATVATCKANGVGFDNVACAVDQGCINGKCKPKVCTPGALLCDGTQVSTCNDSGTASKPGVDCLDSKQKCVAGACVTQVCAPGTKVCQGDKPILGTCNADGTAWVNTVCDDKDPCTTDTCEAKGGVCSAYPKNCDDGDVCTDGDSCKDGNCLAGKAKDCDDKNVCTVDSCDKKLGCSNVKGAGVDADKDGFMSAACGGNDCDDANGKVNPSAKEDCATVGIDDNCDGVKDEGCVPPVQGAFTCVKDGDPCGGKGKCSGGHCFWLDDKGYKWTLVPAGVFGMGCNANFDQTTCYNEKPPHSVELSAFWVGVYEVTVAIDNACVVAQGEGCTKLKKGNSIAIGKDQFPVNYVDSERARALCTWLGGDLPTEAQWEKAARGGCDQYPATDCAAAMPRFPWGSAQPVCGQQAWLQDCANGQTTAVGTGSPLGQSKYGAYDMSGNVMEWVLDWLDPDFYSKPAAVAKDPVNNIVPASGSRGTRGGSIFNPVKDAVTEAATYRRKGSLYEMDRIGMRCARKF